MLKPSRARLSEPGEPSITHDLRHDPKDPSKAVRVPIANIRLPDGGNPAQCEVADYNRMMDAGFHHRWFRHSNGNGKFYIRTTHADDPGCTFIPARFIAGADRGQQVRYADGNPLNLRPSNLKVGKGFAKGAEADIAEGEGF